MALFHVCYQSVSEGHEDFSAIVRANTHEGAVYHWIVGLGNRFQIELEEAESFDERDSREACVFVIPEEDGPNGVLQMRDQKFIKLFPRKAA